MAEAPASDSRTLAADVQETIVDTSLERSSAPVMAGPASSGDPARIGDYVVLHRLGEGGMGVVLAAYDERLDRKVAIKLLRSKGASQPRLIREARALARLSHPNVVQVYEIGEYQETPYIAMEFVDGMTLGDWLAERPRNLDEILAVFDAAGRGLAAAHDKDLIHRDFKPDNVMVHAEGRVIVMDFGLARGSSGEDPATEGGEQPRLPMPAAESVETTDVDPASRSSSLAEDLTVTGALMGTPAYMAPEQFAGTHAGAQTDQFNFCVALWEALHGERPFAGDSVAAISFATTLGRVREPARREVPTWINEILRRGLHSDPRERWPSMSRLLEALAADPTRLRRRRRRLWSVAAAVLVAGPAVWLGARATEQQRRAALEQACLKEAAAMDEDWNEGIRAEVQAAFDRTELSYAAESMQLAGRWMERYAGDWRARRSELCRRQAGLSPHEPPLDDATHAAMVACLDEHREAFGELLSRWRNPDERAVRDAVDSAAQLPLLWTCDDARWLNQRQPPPSAPDTARAVDELVARFEARNREFDAGELAAAIEVLDATVESAEEIGWDPLVARFRLARASELSTAGRFDEARADLEQAFIAAGRAGDDLQAYAAATQMTGLLGMVLAEYDEARHWSRLGEMLLDRMNLRGTIQEARLLNARGPVEASTGAYDDAIASFAGALEIYQREFGEGHPQTATALANLAVAHMMKGDLERAIDAQERALEIRQAVLPSQHPDVAHSLYNLGLAVEEAGDRPRALDLYEQARAIREAIHGAEHPEVAAIVASIGLAHEQEGSLAEARSTLARALALASASLPAEHHEVLDARIALARVELALGSPEEASRVLRPGLDQVEAHGADKYTAYRVGKAQFLGARVAHALGERDEAVRLSRLAATSLDSAESTTIHAELERWMADTLGEPMAAAATGLGE